MALKASPVAGMFPSLRPTASSSPSTSNRPCSLRVLPLRPSFFGNSSGALRVNVLRLACANRLKCNGHGATMNLFERFSRVVKSYANALISSFEDPEKILEQTVIEMNSDLTKMPQATAQWWRKKNPKSYDENCIWCREAKIESDRGAMLLEDLIECCDGKSNPIKFFCADEIRKASDNFNESNYVSELSNSDYKWYSGKNENHHMILIKKAVGSFHGYREGIFCRDIAISSMVSGHKNFLKLIGCCLEFEGPVMVYHGVKKHYQLDPSEQPWEKRMKIAEDIATALAYLHTAFPRPFVYRTMSLGKILLDEDGVAKLSDFSFCVSIPEGETFVQVDRAVGLYSYMDYKYLRNGVVSEKTDVFAMGILVKTLLTGKERFWEICVVEEEADGEGYDDEDSYDSATMSEMNDPGRHFQFRLLQCKEERRRDEIADPKMLEKMGEISEQELCQMKAFRMLSLRCISRRGEVPTMVEVAKELKKIQRSLNHDSSSPSGETQFDSAQDFVSR